MIKLPPVNLALFIENNGMGNAASSGVALAMVTGAAFLTGLWLHRIKAALKHLSVGDAIDFLRRIKKMP